MHAIVERAVNVMLHDSHMHARIHAKYVHVAHTKLIWQL